MITLEELGRYICENCGDPSIRHWELLWDCLDCEVDCGRFVPNTDDEGLIEELWDGSLDETLGQLGGW